MAKENTHPLLDAVRNVVTKDEENPEVLNTFLASVFNSKTSSSWSTQAAELEDSGGEKNEALMIQGEIVSNICYTT